MVSHRLFWMTASQQLVNLKCRKFAQIENICKSCIVCYCVSKLLPTMQKKLHGVQKPLHTVQKKKQTVQKNAHRAKKNVHRAKNQKSLCKMQYINAIYSPSSGVRGGFFPASVIAEGHATLQQTVSKEVSLKTILSIRYCRCPAAICSRPKIN